MLKSKERYNLDCVNDIKVGSVWGTHTTLENINEEVEQRGRRDAQIAFCGILEDYNGNRYAFFKDNQTEENYFVEVQ